jgi:thiamine pyrophosphate-dependent acetolactate synthase large subunit-like protein
MRLIEAVQIISYARTGQVVIATMSAMTAWAETSGSDADLCYFSPMGSASSLGLGLAIARPDVGVIVLDGDGCLLMNLGSLVTIASEAPPNLILFVLENGRYALSGMQPLPGDGIMDLAAMARAAGIARVHLIRSGDELAEQMPDILSARGPVFVSLKVDAEPTPYMDRLTSPSYRARTAREGWHRLHAMLAATG